MNDDEIRDELEEDMPGIPKKGIPDPLSDDPLEETEEDVEGLGTDDEEEDDEDEEE